MPAADDFVNRQAEIGLFKDWLDAHSQRILLLHGPNGIGKTSVLRRLRAGIGADGTQSPLVDFRADRTLSEGEHVIQRLRETIGGAFAQSLAQAEAAIQQDLGSALYGGPALVQGAAQAAALYQGALYQGAAQATGSGAGGVWIPGQVKVGGDIVGGDKIVFNNSPIIVDPAGGLALMRDEVRTRRNTAFRAALAAANERQRLVLFVDHYEEATEEVATWLRRQVLGLHIDGDGEFANLWIVVSGRKVPLQDEVDRWRSVLTDLSLGPLDNEAIYLFWVEKRGLDPANVAVVGRLSAGYPQLLYLMAANWAQTARQGDGR